MKTTDNILFIVLWAVMYVWAMIAFANYVVQSLWLIASQGGLTIEPALELFL
ncbi:MAG: hypothetical protein OEN50_11355 [Deltaproteobacteria bacterium]|nr:hypothetical protein [Deltaproteobacteria bacterium]